MGDELYTIEKGKKVDSLLHAEMLNNPKADDAVLKDTRKHVKEEMGLTKEEIKEAYG